MGETASLFAKKRSEVSLTRLSWTFLERLGSSSEVARMITLRVFCLLGRLTPVRRSGEDILGRLSEFSEVLLYR